jgi:hypothetical protein
MIPCLARFKSSTTVVLRERDDELTGKMGSFLRRVEIPKRGIVSLRIFDEVVVDEPV